VSSFGRRSVDFDTVAFYLKKNQRFQEQAWKNPVGVFDSGVGGLTVLRELVSALPSERFVYLGDTARVPYGGKSARTVTRYAIEIANHLIRTATSSSSWWRATPPRPSPFRSSEDLQDSGGGDGGPVRATRGRLARKSGRSASSGRSGPSVPVRTKRRCALRSSAGSGRSRAPLLVSLAEEGWTENAITRAVIAEYLAPFLGEPPDALILGCTHYPVLKGPIGDFLGAAPS